VQILKNQNERLTKELLELKKNSGQKVSPIIIFHAHSHRSTFFRESHSEDSTLSIDVTIFHIGTIKSIPCGY
jgi:hypothetical protein